MIDFTLTEEQEMLRKTVGEMARKLFREKAAYWDEQEEPPMENLKMLANHGFLGIALPEEYGGAGGSLLDVVIAIEEVAKHCANTAMLMGMTEGATPRALLHLGTEEQKRKYLPLIPQGKLIPAWSMSEPNAGSDVGNIQTMAVLEGNEYIINGSKLFCTGALIADLFVVFVRFGKTPGTKGVGAILVEKGTPGFTVGKHQKVLGLRGTGMAELVFEDCRVPKENLLVPPGGLRQLLTVLDADRVVGNPPISLGVAEGAFEEAVQYVQERQQFGRSLSEFQGIQWMLADMAIDLAAARTLLYKAASRVSGGFPSVFDASAAKTFVNEMAIRVTNTAIQLFGGYGITREYSLERRMRDVRGLAIGYGTTQILRNAIANEVLKGRYR